jgi:hypothetical protein
MEYAQQWSWAVAQQGAGGQNKAYKQPLTAC